MAAAVALETSNQEPISYLPNLTQTATSDFPPVLMFSNGTMTQTSAPDSFSAILRELNLIPEDESLEIYHDSFPAYLQSQTSLDRLIIDELMQSSMNFDEKMLHESLLNVNPMLSVENDYTKSKNLEDNGNEMSIQMEEFDTSEKHQFQESNGNFMVQLGPLNRNDLESVTNFLDYGLELGLPKFKYAVTCTSTLQYHDSQQINQSNYQGFYENNSYLQMNYGIECPINDFAGDQIGASDFVIKSPSDIPQNNSSITSQTTNLNSLILVANDDNNFLSQSEPIRNPCHNKNDKCINYIISIDHDLPMQQQTKISRISGGSSSYKSSSTKLICGWKNCNCKNQFSSWDKFNEHIENHMNDPSARVCYWEDCKRNLAPFKDKNKLLQHTRTHSGYKPYKCPVSTFSKSYFF